MADNSGKLYSRLMETTTDKAYPPRFFLRGTTSLRCAGISRREFRWIFNFQSDPDVETPQDAQVQLGHDQVFRVSFRAIGQLWSKPSPTSDRAQGIAPLFIRRWSQDLCHPL
jgi:hypothetical protein